jgi:hypothetical protein
MSSAFYIPSAHIKGDTLERYRFADFRHPPEFVDITDLIKNNNNIYIDTTTEEDKLYLYRIIYDWDDDVYFTEYVAGYERISTATYITEIAGRPIYQSAISDLTLNRLFGSSGHHFSKYFYTEVSESRYKYRQEPKVYKLPMRRVNFRFRGPLEDYKLILATRELIKISTTINNIIETIRTELFSSLDNMQDINRKSRQLYRTNEKSEIDFRNAVSAIAGSLLYDVISKSKQITRVLGINSLQDSHLVLDTMNNTGLYIVLNPDPTIDSIIESLVLAIKENRYGITDDIYIVVIGEQTPRESLYYE